MQNNQEIYKNPGATILHVLNLPKLPFESHIGPRLLIVASGEEENWRGALVTCPDGQIMRIRGSITGKVFAGKQPDSLIVSIVRGELFSLESDEYGTKNLALIGEEIIKFTKAKLISTHIYEISELKRGLFGTNQEEHLGVERFIILDKSLGTFARSDSYLGKELEFRAVSIGGLEVVKYSFLYPFIPKEKSFQTLAK